MGEARLNPNEVISLVVDGGSSFFLPHFKDLPKIVHRKQLLEIAPYVFLNNGLKTGTFSFHFANFSQDPNFVLSQLWTELKLLFGEKPVKKKILYIQVFYIYYSIFLLCFSFLIFFFS